MGGYQHKESRPTRERRRQPQPSRSHFEPRRVPENVLPWLSKGELYL